LHFIDDSMVIVDKPSGLLAVPGRGEAGRDCLSARLQLEVPDALIVHRLDMGTSGLMVFARGLPALRTLSLAFEQRRVSKRYVAVVDGWLDDDAGQIDAPLIADWMARPRQVIDREIGKPSLTLWRVLAREPEQRTRLELTPVTGRSHQLRVHLASIGHPILGDGLYAAPAITGAAPRMLLHASALTVPHPVDGRAMSFTSPVPF
jgi:tRNA pseudouridine32 synthase/23S rRNA pseudouridine746 synthase